MLVLSRKIGEEIVLPDCGVTIRVIEANAKRVRLGIVAPAATPVHRTEIWRRICREEAEEHESARPDAGGESGPTTDADEAAAGPAPSETLAASLLQWIARRTGSRVRGLAVETVGSRVILSGVVDSYYVRQLAQSAAGEILNTCQGQPPRELECRIAVAHGAEVSASATRPRRTGPAPSGRRLHTPGTNGVGPSRHLPRELV
jgi:carbon storage regulator